jgi:hypothetical protein
VKYLFIPSEGGSDSIFGHLSQSGGGCRRNARDSSEKKLSEPIYKKLIAK